MAKPNNWDQWKKDLNIADMARNIAPGVVFDTQDPSGITIEKGCIAIQAVDDWNGTFEAFDSDGVICLFFVPMVQRITDRNLLVEEALKAPKE